MNSVTLSYSKKQPESQRKLDTSAVNVFVTGEKNELLDKAVKTSLPDMFIVSISVTEEEKKLLDRAIKVSPLAIGTGRKFHSFVGRILSKTLKNVVNSDNTQSTYSACYNDKSKDASHRLCKFLLLLEEDFKNDPIVRREREEKVQVTLRIPGKKEREFLKRNFVINKLVKACLLYAADKIIDLENSSNREINKKIQEKIEKYRKTGSVDVLLTSGGGER